ncbi:MAG TPA: iron-containing alcohol dehydrogenase [Sphaerochaetaceae bacterium]|nr:iron-containing alcohol dehydrogenase [Sphaerochaetaceae bacterium]
MSASVAYSLSNTVRVISGEDSIRKLSSFLSSVGCENPLIILSRGAAETGISDAILAGKGVTTVTASDLHSDTVRVLVKRFTEQHHDGIIAVGGGSTIDLAKVLKLELLGVNTTDTRNEGTVQLDTAHPCYPLIAIPTTIGSGSAATQFAYIFSRTLQRTLYFSHTALFPAAVLLDPKLSKAISPLQTAMGVAAILGRAMESIISTLSTPSSEVYALEAIRLLLIHSFRVVHTPHDLEARLGISIASHLAGLAVSMTGGSLAHAGAVAMHTTTNIPYGQCMMVLLPHALQYNFSGSESALAKIATTVGISEGFVGKQEEDIEREALSCIEWTQTFFTELTSSLTPVPAQRLYDIAGKERQVRAMLPEHLEPIARVIHSSRDLLSSRHLPDMQDIISVLEAAYWGYAIDRDAVRYKHNESK